MCQIANRIHTVSSAAVALTDDTSLRSARVSKLFVRPKCGGLADSFQEGGRVGWPEFDTTLIRQFIAAIIELEYIFARMRITIW